MQTYKNTSNPATDSAEHTPPKDYIFFRYDLFDAKLWGVFDNLQQLILQSYRILSHFIIPSHC